MKLHEFLVCFHFLSLNEDQTTDTTDVSQFEVGMLEIEWKAGHAVRDDNLVQKLCKAFEDILGDIRLAVGAESYLLAQVDERGRENEERDMNPSEAQVSI